MTATFQLKEDDSQTVQVLPAEIEEIVPDADFRFSLLMLKDGRKIFVAGTESEIRSRLNGETVQ
jgi:hypothetical protein